MNKMEKNTNNIIKKLKKRIHTVNLVEIVDGNPIGITSFPDDRGGNDEAESLFTALAKENGIEQDAIDVGLEDGLASVYGDSSNYSICIIHST